MYDSNKALIESLINEQKIILKNNKKIYKRSPEGSLKIRYKNGHNVYRHVRKLNGKIQEKSIPPNGKIAKKLFWKELSRITIERCESNIEILKKTAEKYQSIDGRLIVGDMGKQYAKIAEDMLSQIGKTVAGEEDSTGLVYKRRNDNTGMCIHKTLKGEFVASKSEVIIANALFINNIPYQYDCQIHVLNEKGNHYYVDFLILLPNGEYIYWEHMGMLSESNYVLRSIKKIKDYHNNGICIGRNLIITVDDADGSCDSKAIYDIVNNLIKPHFIYK